MHEESFSVKPSKPKKPLKKHKFDKEGDPLYKERSTGD